MGMLISVLFAAVVCAVVLYAFLGWQPGMSASLQATSGELSRMVAEPLATGTILYVVVYFLIVFLVLNRGGAFLGNLGLVLDLANLSHQTQWAAFDHNSIGDIRCFTAFCYRTSRLAS